MGTSAQFLVAHPSVPANTLTQLIALAKARPGQLNYGSGGIGSLHHLGMEALKASLGLNIQHIPYQGTAKSVPALLNGEVALVFSALPSIEGYLKTSRVRLLAVNTAKRSPQAPDVPTIAEVAGIPDFDYPPEIGVLAPAGTPQSIVTRLAAGIAKAVRHPDTLQRFTTLGIDPVGNTPEAYAAQIRIDIEKYAKAVKISGVKAE
jgi:tripartite-type tricarboxylate transporter receptor subunit TctC